MPNFRPKKVDANQAEIFAALRKCGAVVVDTSQCSGLGFDAVVGIRGRVLLIEIKDGSKPPSKQALTDSEKAAQRDFGGSYHVVRSVDEALALLE